MSREEVAAALRNLQLSLDGLQREVESAIRALPQTRREALPEALAGVRRKLAAFGREAVAELDALAEEAGLQLPGEPGSSGLDADGSDGAASASPAGGEGTPLAYGGVQLRSLERRVASMGGIPALGACVLPKMTPGQRPQLGATASPAAVEIMRGRLGDSDATPLRKVGGEEEGAAPTPLVALRSTPAPAPKSGLDPSPGGGAPPGSELAAAIARRMQRLASASPDKEAAAAAAAAVAAEVTCDS
ncbi:hypothetical protein ABPG75_008497 [Micractinium tetrahymenae]